VSAAEFGQKTKHLQDARLNSNTAMAEQHKRQGIKVFFSRRLSLFSANKKTQKMESNRQMLQLPVAINLFG